MSLLSPEIVWNITLMFLCHVYILLMILTQSIKEPLHISRKTSHKFLHVMIVNLPFIIHFFSSNIFPFFVEAYQE